MTDALDAAAAAGIAALQGDTEQLQPDDTTVVLAVLEERRSNLVGQRTRSVNQLHAVLRELIAGGAPPKLSADKAAALLRAVRPLTAADRARKQVARDLVAEIRGLDRQLAVINNRLQDSVTALGSRLPETVGVGPVIAGRPRRTSPATPAPLHSRSPAVGGLFRQRGQHHRLQRRTHLGFRREGGSGCSVTCWDATASGLSPANGGAPVSSAYSTHPGAYSGDR